MRGLPLAGISRTPKISRRGGPRYRSCRTRTGRPHTADERSWSARLADLRKALSAQILKLTGQHVPPEGIYTDGHLAVAGVDDATFRLYQSGYLVLVRKCAYCATDHFESPPIGNL